MCANAIIPVPLFSSPVKDQLREQIMQTSANSMQPIIIVVMIVHLMYILSLTSLLQERG